ncbi:MAG: SEC-C metal-binding domain-containing protein [Saprospiraceae bacterium]
MGRNDLCPCGSGKKYKHCHGVIWVLGAGFWVLGARCWSSRCWWLKSRGWLRQPGTTNEK